jgi:predicted nucleic acid-binding protein
MTASRLVFADTGYWIALVNPRDDLHTVAAAAGRRLGNAPIVTSELVLVELLNSLAAWGTYWRRTVIEFAGRLQQNAQVTIEPQTHGLFVDDLRRYRDRDDKGYRLTDCASMVIMEHLGIREALTGDHHFQQEGLTILLQRQRGG